MSLRKQSSYSDIIEEKKQLIDAIHQKYDEIKENLVSKVIQRNIILVGRTRTGKSTIKSLLLDPKRIPDDLTLFSHTDIPTLDSYYLADKNFILNIMDTPGLDERGTREFEARDNASIVKDIDAFINREFTKLHIICFCIAATGGVNNQDIQIIQQLLNIFGESVSKNCCLIITHCESQNEEERMELKKQLMQDKYFKQVFGYFKLGVFFSGALNRDDYLTANETLIRQLITINIDRTELIQLFTSNIEPISLELTQISDLKRARDDAQFKETKLCQFQGDLDKTMSEYTIVESELQDTSVKLDSIQSSIEKFEHTITELTKQCNETVQHKNQLQQNLTDLQGHLQKIETASQAQQRECHQILEQLKHEQQAFYSTNQTLTNVRDALLRIEKGCQAENKHLRDMQQRYEQLLGDSKSLREQVKREKNDPQNPPKDKKLMKLFSSSHTK